MLELVAVVAGLENVALIGQRIEQCGGQLGVAEDGGPFRKAQVDDRARSLVEPAQEVETAGAAGLAERQVPELI